VRRRDGGVVTAELAAALPVLVLVVAVALTAVTVAGTRVRAQDAAREAARAAARGDAVSAQRLAADAAPGSSVVLRRDGDLVVATVRIGVHPLAAWLPAVVIQEHAAAVIEPSP
jgi:Flp pilus assembly protein TadG